MLSNKLFISLLLSFISLLVFWNTTYAVYNVDSAKINQLLDKGYFISAAHRSEQLCKDNIKNYSNTANYYDRSECFRSDNKYYYLKCEKNARCDLNYLFNLSTTNTNNTTYKKPNNTNQNNTNNNNNTNVSTTNIAKVYLYRTFNNKTGKYYLKYSTNSSVNSVITHDGEYVDSVYVLSSKNVSGTTAVYLWWEWADGYITYNPTSKLIWYSGNNSDNWKIAIYNCYKWQDFFITTDSACNGYKRYNNSVFYVYPAKIDNNNSNSNSNNNNNNSNNINWTVTADSYISDDNILTIIANTELNRNNISFCVIWKDCVKISNKWEEYKVGNTNKRAWYKITIMWIPAWVYEWYFKYVSADWILRKSNSFRQVIKRTEWGNLTLISKQKLKAYFTIPEWYNPRFFLNYNWGEYNLIDEWWNITRSNGLLNYTQNLSLFIRWVYDAYVTYWNNRIEFNSVSVK